MIQHIEKGGLSEATCVSFHYYGNGQFMIAMFFVVLLIVSWNKSSERRGFVY